MYKKGYEGDDYKYLKKLKLKKLRKTLYITNYYKNRVNSE